MQGIEKVAQAREDLEIALIAEIASTVERLIDTCQLHGHHFEPIESGVSRMALRVMEHTVTRLLNASHPNYQPSRLPYTSAQPARHTDRRPDVRTG